MSLICDYCRCNINLGAETGRISIVLSASDGSVDRAYTITTEDVHRDCAQAAMSLVWKAATNDIGDNFVHLLPELFGLPRSD